MCNYSLSQRNVRGAVEGETLLANSHYSGHSGTLGPSCDELVCAAHEAKLTIENFQVSTHCYAIRASDGERLPHDNRFDRTRHAGTSYSNKIGTRQVVTFLDGNVLDTGYDYIEFEDGICIMLAYLKQGTEVYVGVKPTLEDKLGIDEKGIAIAALDINTDVAAKTERDDVRATEFAND